MKKSEKILFIAALIVSAAALFMAGISAYFGIYFAVLKFGASGDGIAQAFTAVFFVLFVLISWALSVLSVPLFVLAPLRSEKTSVRRTSLVVLCVLGAFFLLNVCLFIMII